MDTLKKIEKLFEQAGATPTPVLRVSDGVLADLQAYRTPRLIPLSIFAGISAAAAAVLLLVAIQAWRYMNDPVLELVASIQETPLW